MTKEQEDAIADAIADDATKPSKGYAALSGAVCSGSDFLVLPSHQEPPEGYTEVMIPGELRCS